MAETALERPNMLELQQLDTAFEDEKALTWQNVLRSVGSKNAAEFGYESFGQTCFISDWFEYSGSKTPVRFRIMCNNPKKTDNGYIIEFTVIPVVCKTHLVQNDKGQWNPAPVDENVEGVQIMRMIEEDRKTGKQREYTRTIMPNVITPQQMRDLTARAAKHFQTMLRDMFEKHNVAFTPTDLRRDPNSGNVWMLIAN